MKTWQKLTAVLLLIFMLCGCGPVQEQDGTQAKPAVTTEPTAPTTAVPLSDPYEGMTAAEFYADYTPAGSYEDAQYRSQHGFLSGLLEWPEQDFSRATEQPREDGMYVFNTRQQYEDNGNTYVVTDSEGNEVLRIYKGGAYITLEEVAAYMYAFGGSKEDLPANYVAKKSTKPSGSIWGEYLRVNHTYYKNDPRKYPYEPKLPGDDLRYYEMDIGTTGTTTPGHGPKIYNNGTTITRGAARLVYTREDVNGNGIYEPGEVYVFYTHNHYNDFTEYLNYYGGWGETFGNITGGGEFDSKTDYRPTPYPEVFYAS
jgi:hypothetical protein